RRSVVRPVMERQELVPGQTQASRSALRSCEHHSPKLASGSYPQARPIMSLGMRGIDLGSVSAMSAQNMGRLPCDLATSQIWRTKSMYMAERPRLSTSAFERPQPTSKVSSQPMLTSEESKHGRSWPRRSLMKSMERGSVGQRLKGPERGKASVSFWKTQSP